jgi:hypothetical protein
VDASAAAAAVDAGVRFADELADEQRKKLGREDFIQTDLADEAETWAPGGASDPMQSFGGSEPPLSPALRDDGDTD